MTLRSYKWCATRIWTVRRCRHHDIITGDIYADTLITDLTGDCRDATDRSGSAFQHCCNASETYYNCNYLDAS